MHIKFAEVEQNNMIKLITCRFKLVIFLNAALGLETG